MRKAKEWFYRKFMNKFVSTLSIDNHWYAMPSQSACPDYSPTGEFTYIKKY